MKNHNHEKKGPLHEWKKHPTAAFVVFGWAGVILCLCVIVLLDYLNLL